MSSCLKGKLSHKILSEVEIRTIFFRDIFFVNHHRNFKSICAASTIMINTKHIIPIMRFIKCPYNDYSCSLNETINHCRAWEDNKWRPWSLTFSYCWFLLPPSLVLAFFFQLQNNHLKYKKKQQPYPLTNQLTKVYSMTAFCPWCSHWRQFQRWRMFALRCWRTAPHTTTAAEIYVLYVCWAGLIIQSDASEDPSMSRALSGSSRQNALFCFFFFPSDGRQQRWRGGLNVTPSFVLEKKGGWFTCCCGFETPPLSLASLLFCPPALLKNSVMQNSL